MSPLSVRRLSSVCPLTFHILINSSEATGPIWTKLWLNGPLMVPFQNCVRWPRPPTKMSTITKNRKFSKKWIKKSSPETAWPIWTKPWWNGPYVVPFQNCVRQHWPPTKMATVTKNITECKHRVVTYHKTQNGKCCWDVRSVVHYRIQVAIFSPKWLLLLKIELNVNIGLWHNKS